MCGGHFNPIVSLALFLDRRLGTRETIERWIAQFAGAVLAALALLLMSSSDAVGKAATVPGIEGVRGAFFAEIFCSAIFVMVILHVTTSKIFASTTYVAIALTPARDPLRDHPVQRLVREPGAELRHRPRRHHVDQTSGSTSSPRRSERSSGG